MNKTVIHIDMDAFFAAVEVRDNPELAGKPLIIGALPQERGVVSTCSYEARKFGVRSAMSIKEAYRLCPQGIYMHPDITKYRDASVKIHAIWGDYTDLIEYVSLDEGYLDVTGSAHLFGGAREIAFAIKRRTKTEIGLTCSVGIGYSMMSAKLASEEKKPDGFFEIPNIEALKNLISGRNVRAVYGIGIKTAEQLQKAGITKVSDICANKETVLKLLGNHGKDIIQLAEGIDTREVTPYFNYEAKSIGREYTFQKDTTDFDYLKEVLVLFAKELSLKLRLDNLFARTVTVKVTYGNMQQITRSKSGNATNNSDVIYKTAATLLDAVERHPVRLVGISLSNIASSASKQMTFDDLSKIEAEKRQNELYNTLLKLQRKYGGDIIKTGKELKAEQRCEADKEKL